MKTSDLLLECESQGIQLIFQGDSLKATGKPEALKRLVPMLKSHKQEIQAELIRKHEQAAKSFIERLSLFCFDLSEQEIEAGADLAELDRINNMAWEFMEADGLEFSESIKIAQEIVKACRVATCEAAYTKVRSLVERAKDESL